MISSIKNVLSHGPLSHQFERLSKSSKDYEQLMSYVSEEKKGEINKKIDRVESSSIEKVENIVASHCFEGIFFDEEFEFYGLALVKAGRLSAIQFGTLMAMRAALLEDVKSWEVVSLFEDESISIRAWALLSDTLFYLKRSALTRKELSRFFECMRDQPVSEQFFLLVPDMRSNPDDISLRVHKIRLFNLFCGIEEGESQKRMIISYGMIQALLDATGNDGFRIKPVIGVSTEMGMLLSMKNENAREICVHCPISGPASKIADSHTATPSTFIYHDFYHAWACRHIPKEHRELYLSLAEWSFSLSQTSPSEIEKVVAKTFHQHLLDMDFLFYQPNSDHWIDHQNHNRIVLYIIKNHFKRIKGLISVGNHLDLSLKILSISRQLKSLTAVWFINRTVSFDRIVERVKKLDKYQEAAYIDRVFRDFPCSGGEKEKDAWRRNLPANLFIC